MKNIENIFENKSRTKATIAKRNYDIRVTLNKNGKNSFAILSAILPTTKKKGSGTFNLSAAGF